MQSKSNMTNPLFSLAEIKPLTKSRVSVKLDIVTESMQKESKTFDSNCARRTRNRSFDKAIQKLENLQNYDFRDSVTPELK